VCVCVCVYRARAHARKCCFDNSFAITKKMAQVVVLASSPPLSSPPLSSLYDNFVVILDISLSLLGSER